MSSAELKQLLKELQDKRKKRQISAAEFYKGLLDLMSRLAQDLRDEEIPETQIKKQIPLLLTFINAQIKAMAERGE
ncbi:MAG: hypothetical protein ABGX24_03140 [Aquificota bacterium]|jgi:hypothetical protein